MGFCLSFSGILRLFCRKILYRELRPYIYSMRKVTSGLTELCIPSVKVHLFLHCCILRKQGIIDFNFLFPSLRCFLLFSIIIVVVRRAILISRSSLAFFLISKTIEVIVENRVVCCIIIVTTIKHIRIVLEEGTTGHELHLSLVFASSCLFIGNLCLNLI